MEFGLREWLTIFVGLLIVGIVLDGWRRMRASKVGSIKMSRSVGKGVEMADDDDDYGSELPNGPSRVVGYRDTDDVRNAQEGAERSTSGVKTSNTPLKDLGKDVPMLMEAIEEQAFLFEPSAPEPALDEQLADKAVETPSAHIEEDRTAVFDEPVVPATPESNQAVVEAQEKRDSNTEAEEVFVINVMAGKGESFSGARLLEILLAKGMRFGEMSIFHHHLDEDGEGPVLFSMANMVKPGTFKLSQMDTFTTPGVSFFMVLPVATDSMSAFNRLVDTAQALAETLNGELKDENRSVMTAQTIEHCRQRIQDFERRRLM